MEDKVGIEHQITFRKGKLNYIYDKIKTTVELGRTLSTDLSQLTIFEARFRDLKKLYDRFESIFDDLSLYCIRAGQEQEFPDSSCKALASNAERYYYECCVLYGTYGTKGNTSNSTTYNNSTTTDHSFNLDRTQSRARLSLITLSQFSGEISEWTHFRNTFNSLVHNDTSLPTIDKFHYLLGATSYEPHRICRRVPLSESNYPVTYKTLLFTADSNFRVLPNLYVDTILDFTHIKSKPTLGSLNSLVSFVSSITSNLPSTLFPSYSINQFSSLHLADPRFWVPAPVEFLLDNDLFMSVLTGGKLSFGDGELNGLSTIFGWISIGRFKRVKFLNSDLGHTLLFVSSSLLGVEEPCSGVLVAPEDEPCEQHFVQTHSLDLSGRYMFHLPFKQPDSLLFFNRQVALSRILKLEQRLLRHPTLYVEYSSFLKESLDPGHMLVTKNSTDHIFSHQYILNQRSSTTKFRVIFYDSFKRVCNNFLLLGPKPQAFICDIALNFGHHLIVFIVDIFKVFTLYYFSNIILHPDYRKLVHIILRFRPHVRFKLFELETINYGFGCDPFQVQNIRHLIKELDNSIKGCAELIQRVYYRDEVSNTSSRSFSTTLGRLTTVFDRDGIFRVGGRIRSSDIKSTIKYPIFPAASCIFSNFIFDYFDKVYLHAGSRKTYNPWIIMNFRFLECAVSFTTELLSTLSVTALRRFLNYPLQAIFFLSASFRVVHLKLVSISLTWPLARATAMHLSNNNVVQVVTVQTSTETFINPVSKIVLLEDKTPQ